MLHLSSARAAWGFGFEFETDDEALAHVMTRAYSDLPAADWSVTRLSARRTEADGHVGYVVTVRHPDGRVEPCGEGRGPAKVLELLCWEINRRARLSAAERTVLHAAVVGGPLGAVVLCGESHSGKSTLAAAAAQRGWRHLSDDLALIDVPTLTVAPYARPVMLRAGGRAHLERQIVVPAEQAAFFGEEWFVPASQLGATIVHEPQPLVAVCMLQWGDQAALQPLGRAELLHGMLTHSATIAARGEAGFDELVQLAHHVPGHRLVLGGAHEALGLIAPLVGAS